MRSRSQCPLGVGAGAGGHHKARWTYPTPRPSQEASHDSGAVLDSEVDKEIPEDLERVGEVGILDLEVALGEGAQSPRLASQVGACKPGRLD